MENTGKVLFEDDVPQWYVAISDKPVGPLTASDVYQKVVNQEITWAHHVWKPGMAAWEKICDTKTFQAVVPTPPPMPAMPPMPGAKPTVKQAKKPPHNVPKIVEEEKSWFLHYKDSQYGPFAESEVIRFLKVGKLHEKIHAWRNGMTDWETLASIDVFKDACVEAKKTRGETKVGPTPPPAPKGKGKDQRGAPRRPLVAKIVMAGANADVVVGMCRDISIGGLQVLTDRIPGPVGTRVKMNVSSTNGTGSGAAKKSQIAPFVAEGVVVRILEDQRGFSFRFDRLSDSARKTIEQYIESSS